MSAEAVLDFDRLLALIPGDEPAGRDLRSDLSPTSLYYAVKDARNAARAAERQALVDGEDTGGPVDWRPVLQHGCAALATASKDLEIAAYVIEALVRQHGFTGLRNGFRLARELVERYWDELYPRPDEDGTLTRVAPLTVLNGDDSEGTLIGPIAKVPLTEGNSCGPFAYFHYQQAAALAQIVDEEARQARIDRGAVSLALIERAVGETPASFFAQLVADLRGCLDEYSQLGALLDERCGSQAPPQSNIRSALTACLDMVTALARDKLAVASATGETSLEPEGAKASAKLAGPSNGNGAIRSREDAFQQLLNLAEFFKKTEPHTPISFALEQVVRWGRMSLPDLLTELIPDEGSRQQLFRFVGIRPPAQS
jgi:type VI secretion system protein ImpA